MTSLLNTDLVREFSRGIIDITAKDRLRESLVEVSLPSQLITDLERESLVEVSLTKHRPRRESLVEVSLTSQLNPDLERRFSRGFIDITAKPRPREKV